MSVEGVAVGLGDGPGGVELPPPPPQEAMSTKQVMQRNGNETYFAILLPFMSCVGYIGFGVIFTGDLNFAVISITAGILANWRLIVQYLCQIGSDVKWGLMRLLTREALFWGASL